MKRDIVLKWAASALVMGTAMIGCTPKGMEHPATLSSAAPRVAPSKASQAAGNAMLALSRHKPDKAVTAAETAVALAPRDAVYRALLGQAYLAAGRFASAETSFHDAMTLAPDDRRAAMNLAITRIALGKWDEARADLAALKGKVGETDRGLALALAGDPAGAVEALEAAARIPGADAKTRQNLALAYALDGRWAQARVTASQDLQGDLLDARMREWALLSQPKAAWDQVASLLHITPVEDPGQPTALALAAPVGQAPVALASAAPAVPVQAPIPVVDAAPPMEIVTPAPVPAAFAERPASTPMIYADAAPAEAARAPAPAVAEEAMGEPARPARPAQPEARRVTSFIQAAAHRQPARVPLTRAEPSRAPRIIQHATGGFVVQLGAYSSADRVETAWHRQRARLSPLAGYTPSSATFQHSGATFYRLTLSGFATRGEAVRLCETIRARGGACFVRAAAGEQIAQWRSEPSPTQFAAR